MKSPRLAKIWRQNSLCVLFLTAWIGATSATVTDLATFTERCAKLATAAEEKSQRAVTGEEGWLFLQAELAHLGHGPLSREVCQPAVDSIVAYHKALEALGVQLMVLPIPAKAEVFPDKLLPDCPADLLANRMADFLTMLKEQGVTIVPFREALQKDRADTYCRTDSHWSPKGAELAAKLVREAWKKDIGTQPELTAGKPTALQIQGDLLGEPHTAKIAKESIQITSIGKVDPMENSPFVLVGDSHTLVFSAGASLGFHCESAGLPEHLQFHFRSLWQQISAPADGAYQARIKLRDKARGEFWPTKKLVVWTFSVREITAGNWKPVALQRGVK